MEFTSHCQFGDNLVCIMQYWCNNLLLEGWKKKFGVEWLMVQSMLYGLVVKCLDEQRM